VLAGGRTSEGVHYREPVETPRLFQASVDVVSGRVLTPPEPMTQAAASAAGNPAWSRDGLRLAFTLRVPNRIVYRIMVSDASGASPREVARVDVRVVGLDWSADGKFIVLAGRGEARGSSWVGRIDVASGAVERLAPFPATAVSAGPGEQVAYVRAAAPGESQVQVTVLPKPGAAPRVLATYPVEEVPRSLSVSPDGAWVAVMKPVDERRASVLQLLPMAGGLPRDLLRLERPEALEWNLGTIPWTTNGRRLLVMTRRSEQNQFVAVRVDSGERAALPLSAKRIGRQHPALNPDGRRIVYVDGVDRAELKVLVGSRD